MISAATPAEARKLFGDSLDKPGHRPAYNSLKILNRLRERGYKPGHLAGDRPCRSVRSSANYKPMTNGATCPEPRARRTTRQTVRQRRLPRDGPAPVSADCRAGTRPGPPARSAPGSSATPPAAATSTPPTRPHDRSTAAQTITPHPRPAHPSPAELRSRVPVRRKPRLGRSAGRHTQAATRSGEPHLSAANPRVRHFRTFSDITVLPYSVWNGAECRRNGVLSLRLMAVGSALTRGSPMRLRHRWGAPHHLRKQSPGSRSTPIRRRYP
ncbi:hypothetical protein SM007_36460 [Streptomyces avermitilis]|nr:hypothetical protein SM007_36460 [Streptomyces avermitilis]